MATVKQDEKNETCNEYTSADKLNFELSKHEIAETKQIYAVQCDGLSNKEEQKDLWKTLAICRKNKVPLLTLVIDSFTRDRIDYYVKYKKPLQLQQWSIRYPTLKTVSKKKRHQEMIQAAAQTFFHRYSSMIQLPVMEKYDDSIEVFTEYITEATSLINNILCSNDLVIPPFQIDLLIVPQKVVDCSKNDSNGNSDDNDDSYDENDFDDDDDDDDSDDDSDDDTGTGDEGDDKDDHDPFAAITDIKKKLDEKNIIYTHKILSNGYRPRLFQDLFKDFQFKLSKDNKNTNNKKNNSFGFPHKERIVIVLDRRKGLINNKNELFIYKPDIFNEIPDSHVSEWYFQSSFKSIIPGKKQNDTITAKTSANGYVFCLSFQIEQKDSIKCYLYTRSQMIRFLPDDIHNLLPHLFIVKDGDRNYKFIQNEKKYRSKTQNIKLIDTQFDKFRAETSTKTKSSQ